jgi:hypothetical protein
MKSLPISFFSIFIASLPSYSAMANTEKQAVENFNRETGELYWELDSEVRLRYIPICKTVTDDFDTLNEIIHDD